jgi:arabinogalactan oligomer / maltooligosaccharide transport system substrate-binding protein
MLRRSGRFVAVAAAASLGLGLAIVPAQAATKTIVVWADETRGPQLQQQLKLESTVVKGYRIQVKAFASFDALKSAWDKSTAATGPDIVIGSAAWGAAGAKSGKLAPVTYPAKVRSQFSKSTIEAMSYKGKTYGVALDLDTTAFAWNTDLYGKQPTTIKEMVDHYLANKSKYSAGFCSFNGEWGAHPIITGLGGGAFTSDYTKTLINSAAFKSNVKSLLLGSDGKSNGFFKPGGCDGDFKAGKIPFAGVGAWNLGGIAESNTKIKLGYFPGSTTKARGAQWVNYSGAFLTSYAKRHGVEAGARQLLLNYFAGDVAQARMSVIGKRPPANIAAAKRVSDPQTKAIAAAGQTGTPQVGALLDDQTGGANWYGLVGDVFSKILNEGANVDSTLDQAAAVLLKNFANARKNL